MDLFCVCHEGATWNVKVATSTFFADTDRMKWYSLYFFPLKIMVVFQFILVLLGKQQATMPFYIITDTLFKVSIAVFTPLFFLLNPTIPMDLEDRMIMSFAGLLILFSIDTDSILALIHRKASQ